MQMFNLAVDDLQASIGEILVPVLKFGTDLFRKLGDAVSTVSGPLRRLLDTLFSTWSDRMGDIFGAMTPILELLAI